MTKQRRQRPKRAKGPKPNTSPTSGQYALAAGVRQAAHSAVMELNEIASHLEDGRPAMALFRLSSLAVNLTYASAILHRPPVSRG